MNRPQMVPSSVDAVLMIPRFIARLAAVSAFASIRFDGVVPSAAEELQQAMAERGASLEIIDLCAPSCGPFRET